MGHRPHLYLPSPWTGTAIDLSNNQRHHLRSVLRLEEQEIVTYTDGAGLVGTGHLEGNAVVRSTEEPHPPPQPQLTLAVAPPRDKERARFLVEKAAELEVTRLVWLEARFGQGHPPPIAKSGAWAVSALEQSRSAHLLQIEPGPLRLAELEQQPWAGEIWLTEAGGGAVPGAIPTPITVAIGPEGGWAPEELGLGLARMGLGRTILRVETAALAVAALLMRS